MTLGMMARTRKLAVSVLLAGAVMTASMAAEAEAAEAKRDEAAGQEPKSAAPVETKSRGVSVGAFLGGLVVPGGDVSAVAGGLMLNLPSGASGWQTRLQGVGYRVEDKYTQTSGAALLLHATYWTEGVYGIGLGSGLGYATFTAKEKSGWDDSSAQLLVYASPVQLRFQGSPGVELGMNIGATRFFAHDVRPFGYLYAGLVF
jgi:hypothetical protein